MSDRPRRQIEREFGVPIAGEIQDPSLWTNTALKKLPTQVPFPWDEIFGRHAPRVLDIGCGNGRFLIGSAVWRPDHDHLGIDVLPVVIRYATRRANQRGLANIRFAVIDGYAFLAKYAAPFSLDEIHCYHPQPYYDRAQVRRRLFTPEFLMLLHGTLRPEGKLFLQTDNPGYWRYLQEVVPFFFEMQVRIGPWPDAPKGRTRREIIALRRGLPVFRATAVPRRGLQAEEALRLAQSLSPPVFDADRKLRQADEAEKSG